jgi:hypothetical protein
LDNPPPSLSQSGEEGSQTVRREVFFIKRLKRQSDPGRNLSSMRRNLREEMPVEESPSKVMDMANVP